MDKGQYKLIREQEYKRDHAFIDACESCKKTIRKKDGDYALFKWRKVLCYDHSPLGKIPKSSDPIQRMKDAAITSLPDNASRGRVERLNAMLTRITSKA